MSFNTLPWEINLINLAHEALDSHTPDQNQPQYNHAVLEQAYHYCDQLTQVHSKTFYMASNLLPDVKRKAVRALYAFCRISDDLVDRANGDVLDKLNSWKDRTVKTNLIGDDAVALAWNDTRHNFQIPWRYAEQLIDGVAQDLDKKRYQSFEELTTYCYGVACTVGLMSMHIIGFSGPEAIPYAIRLGVALQLTNILRDVGEDWEVGRLYLPKDELNAFGLSEDDIDQCVIDQRWKEFMRFQIDRNRKLYQEALPGVILLDQEGRFAIGAAAELYQAILQQIETNDYDVFNQRASVSKFGKLRMLPGIWWRANRGGYQKSLAIR